MKPILNRHAYIANRFDNILRQNFYKSAPNIEFFDLFVRMPSMAPITSTTIMIIKSEIINHIEKFS